ncbi:MAG: MFS transporter [Opitutaceae bacterium]
MVFGPFGDRIGRKSMLVVTLVMMGLATFLVGVLPTYEDVGILAPMLLVILRLVQGAAVGGERGGAVLMVAEHANSSHRGFSASWVQAGVPVGLLLATSVFSVFTLLPEASFLAWGWRVPFLLGIVLTALGFFIRLRVLESPVFEQAKAPPARLPIADVLREHLRSVFLSTGARLAENVFFYIFQRVGIELRNPASRDGEEHAAQRRVARLPGAACGDPGFWRAFRSAGPKARLYWRGDFSAPVHAAVLSVAGNADHGMRLARHYSGFFSELFGTRTRYTGASLGYQLAAPFAGGIAPLVASGLLQWSENMTWPVAVYLMAMAAITIGFVLLIRETNGTDLRDHTNAIA